MTELKKSDLELDNMLGKLSKKQLRRLQMPRNIYKLQRMLTRDFCKSCRDLAINNSRRPYSDYCVDCQEVAGKVLRGILK